MEKMKFCPICRSGLGARKIDGKERLTCSSASCGYVHWDSPIPVVAGIVEHNGMIILGRNKAWPEKMFGLITGFLEKDEDPAEGILREVEEELGLLGRLPKLVGLYPFAMMNQLIIAYHVIGEGEIQLGQELAQIKQVAPQKLKPWNFGTGLAVRDWMASQGLMAS